MNITFHPDCLRISNTDHPALRLLRALPAGSILDADKMRLLSAEEKAELLASIEREGLERIERRLEGRELMEQMR